MSPTAIHPVIEYDNVFFYPYSSLDKFFIICY